MLYLYKIYIVHVNFIKCMDIFLSNPELYFALFILSLNLHEDGYVINNMECCDSHACILITSVSNVLCCLLFLFSLRNSFILK